MQGSCLDGEKEEGLLHNSPALTILDVSIFGRVSGTSQVLDV
jgi:hypothetical protein